MKIAIILLITLFGSQSENNFKINSDEVHFRIENNVMAREIRFSSDTPTAIQPVSVFDKKKDYELLADQNLPWFDFTVNGEAITNLDKSWLYHSQESRLLENGGIEISLHFHRLGGAADQLNITHVAQYFPDATIFREKIILGGGENLSLNYRNGKVYMVFPNYQISGDVMMPEKIQEINLATWNAELIPDREHQEAFDERVFEEGWRQGRNLANNYMYHPVFQEHEMTDRSVRGPLAVLLSSGNNNGWVTAYEHGSPDMDKDQEYIEIDSRLTSNGWSLQTRTQKGAFFDGERVSDNNQFESVWVMNGFYSGNSFDDGHKIIWQYLHTWIVNDGYSRVPMFYYNTWGWQRSAGYRGLDEREVLTESRILEEIDNAAEMGVELFVLDDGWQNNFGDWVPDDNKLPNGLAPLREKLEEKGMVFGIWLALFAHDPFSEVARQNPDWIILDDDGEPEIGNWDRQVFNFVGPYMEYFIDINKRLIDEGVRYFKWDGMDRHLNASPNNYHGGPEQTPDERKARYGYELSRYVTRAIAELKDYREDIVIEVDITEPHRSVGLNILSEGKYFWMNNGSTWYDDYTHYRAMSTRFPLHRYGRIIPPVLMTVANYPHDSPLNRAQRYNINSSIAGGHGIWGDIDEMDVDERRRVALYLKPAKAVASAVAGVRPDIIGDVGGSPEIYTFIDSRHGQGQIIAFSGSALEYDYVYNLSGTNSENILGIVGHSYSIGENRLLIPFRFPMGLTSREAFLLTNNGNGISIMSSTGWLQDIIYDEYKLTIISGSTGELTISWPENLGFPVVNSEKEISYDVDELSDGSMVIMIRSYEPEARIVVTN
jgi:hypothetical protein